MSVPSLKTIVTTETPNFEIDRICSTSGSPLIAPETGNDSSESTSSGESAGASVITWTCTFVRSGTASIGRWSAEYTPSPATSSSRHQHEEAVVQRRFDDGVEHGLGLLFLVGSVLKDQLALEQESAGGDDLVSVGQAGLDLDAVAGLAADLDGPKSEGLVIGCSLPAGTKTYFSRFDLDDRGRRDGQDLFAGGAIEHDPHEHPQLEQVVGVLGLGEERDGSGLGVDHGPDRKKPGREFAVGVGRGGQAERAVLELGQLGDVRLRDVGRDPDGAEIGQDEEDVVQVGLLAGDGDLS